MIYLLSYLGGVLTILSPCVLPVIPFIFSRSDQPFRKSGLPILIGMGLSFATFAALSVVGGRWVIQANYLGRVFALVVFGLLGLALLFPRFAERLSLPVVRLGGRLQKRADQRQAGWGSSLILGASIGLLWAPCAGPILGLVLAGAVVGHSNEKTFFLLLVFALGAATSLGVAIFAGGKALRILKKGMGAEEWIKRFLGVAVLVAVVAIAFGWDTQILSQISYLNTSQLEQNLIDQTFHEPRTSQSQGLTDEGIAPEIEGATEWINSNPLTLKALRGKVVLIDFWTYSCINCLRTLPHVRSWDEKYRDQGLVVIGVHTPEFAFEKSIENVKKAVSDLKIQYPVAVDSDETIWVAFKNRYWPAHYLIDAQGRVRFHHFGEGGYEEAESAIRGLLKEVKGAEVNPPAKILKNSAVSGVEVPPSQEAAISPETYLGYARERGFISTPGIQEDQVTDYRVASSVSRPLVLNQWGLSGTWKVGPEMGTLVSSRGSLVFRFRARDVHLVMGIKSDQSETQPHSLEVPFRVLINGKAPGKNHGEDVDESGRGQVQSHRLYQLIRMKDRVQGEEAVIQIEFEKPGLEVYAFTFG